MQLLVAQAVPMALLVAVLHLALLRHLAVKLQVVAAPDELLQVLGWPAPAAPAGC